MSSHEEKSLIHPRQPLVHDAQPRSYRKPFLQVIFLYVLFVIGMDVCRRGQATRMMTDRKEAARCPPQGEALLKGKQWVGGGRTE